MEDEVAIIVLAAGASSRLGMPKQNLSFKQTTLLQHSIEQALASKASAVVVILGAEAGIIQTHTSNPKLEVLINDAWQEGIASSIRCGVQYLVDNQPSVTRALLMVCDQPYINTALLNKLITLQQAAGAAIVASRYGDTIGIPALFAKQLFPELLQLTGDKGAKKMMMKHRDNLTIVDFPLGIVDIDTAEDYTSIYKNEKN